MPRTSISVLPLASGFAGTLALAGISLKKGIFRRRRIAELLALAALACGSVAMAQTAHLNGYQVPVEPPCIQIDGSLPVCLIRPVPGLRARFAGQSRPDPGLLCTGNCRSMAYNRSCYPSHGSTIKSTGANTLCEKMTQPSHCIELTGKMSGHDSDRASSLTHDAAQQNERLVTRISAGDRDAEHEFALRYSQPVRAMLLARSRSPDLAADLQQDVLIEAICALRRGQLRDPGKLSGFVIAIARNKLYTHYRANRRTEILEFPDDLPDLSSATDRVEEQLRESTALEVIASLDPVDRKILEMTLVEGLKPGVIAKRLQLSPDVVRQRKLRATRRVTESVRRQSQTQSPDDLIAGRLP